MREVVLCFAVSDDKTVQEEEWVVCQHPECPERRRASKVRPLNQQSEVISLDSQLDDSNIDHLL